MFDRYSKGLLKCSINTLMLKINFTLEKNNDFFFLPDCWTQYEQRQKSVASDIKMNLINREDRFLPHFSYLAFV